MARNDLKELYCRYHLATEEKRQQSRSQSAGGGGGGDRDLKRKICRSGKGNVNLIMLDITLVKLLLCISSRIVIDGSIIAVVVVVAKDR